MARDGAIVVTWGNAVSGREARSLEVFTDFLTYWGKHAADDHCADPEPFFSSDGSSGMVIIRGRSDALQELWDSEENERLFAKGHMVVNDLKAHVYYTGQEIQRGTQIFAEAGTELGFM